MSRIRLLDDDELTPQAREQVQQMEAAGADTAILRALANRQDMFDRYFGFYGPSNATGTIESPLKELVRLKIARLNDCFT